MTLLANLDDEKAILLLAASQKPVKNYLQLDGFLDVEPGDCIMHPDKDGDVCMGGVQAELRNGVCAVRVQIEVGTCKADAIRVLKKLRRWVKRLPTSHGRLVDFDRESIARYEQQEEQKKKLEQEEVVF